MAKLDPYTLTLISRGLDKLGVAVEDIDDAQKSEPTAELHALRDTIDEARKMIADARDAYLESLRR